MLASLLFCSFILLSCEEKDEANPEFALDQPDQLAADEYQVYSAIREHFGQDQMVLRQETSGYTPPKDHFELFLNLVEFADMESGLYERYVAENLDSYLLDEKIEVPAKETKLISGKEYAYYFGRADSHKAWELFNQNYPAAAGWLYAFNKIGFNTDRTQAIVGIEAYWFMESPEGPTLRQGSLYYLEKRGGIWTRLGSTSYPLGNM